MSLVTLWALTAHAQTFTLNAACAPHDETDVNTVQCQSWCQFADRAPRRGPAIAQQRPVTEMLGLSVAPSLSPLLFSTHRACVLLSLHFVPHTTPQLGLTPQLIRPTVRPPTCADCSFCKCRGCSLCKPCTSSIEDDSPFASCEDWCSVHDHCDQCTPKPDPDPDPDPR